MTSKVTLTHFPRVSVECFNRVQQSGKFRSVKVSFQKLMSTFSFFSVVVGCIRFLGIASSDWWRYVKKGRTAILKATVDVQFLILKEESLEKLLWCQGPGTPHKLSRHNQTVQQADCPPVYSVYFIVSFMRNNPLSLLIPMLLLIQLLALLC